MASRPAKATPCQLPHFTKDGEPKDVAGLVYRHAEGSAVLCRSHGQQLIDRMAESR